MKKIVLKDVKQAVPLTTHEMMSIVGGLETFLCQCVYMDSGGNVINSGSVQNGESGTFDADHCDTYCQRQCNDNSSGTSGCNKYLVSFSYTKEETIL
jgi:hypothetical protein